MSVNDLQNDYSPLYLPLPLPGTGTTVLVTDKRDDSFTLVRVPVSVAKDDIGKWIVKNVAGYNDNCSWMVVTLGSLFGNVVRL